MLSYNDLILRYPAMATLTPERFALFQGDAILVMGSDETRWFSWYNQAMAALIAHMVTLNDASTMGDGGLVVGPVTRTDVDDVQVEFAEKIWDRLPYQEAALYSTAYGLAYVGWRRMAFAGPRIA